MKSFIYCICLFLSVQVVAQSSFKASEIIKIEKGGEISPKKVTDDWAAFIYHNESPYPGSNSARNYSHQLKALLKEQRKNNVQNNKQNQSYKTNAFEPDVLQGFQGNRFGGIPNDNDLAISNDGILISVTNSLVYIYDTESNTRLDSLSLNVFADSLDLPANSYDPKVIYDPKQDKFILIFLNGSDADNTAIAVCFTQTNNPVDGWNMYSISGNPLDDNAWSDFPAIAMTDDELFLTLNHINSDSVSWQTGFMRSIIWQIGKEEGYNGDSLNTRLYHDVQFDNTYIRNLTPMKGGITTKSPDMYFVSNRNFDAENDTFFIVHISDNIANINNIELTTDYFTVNQKYGMPPHVHQPNTSAMLQTNDSRPLGGFYEGGKIHFVGNTYDSNTGLCAIYHTIVPVTGFNNQGEMQILAGQDSLEYGYPNISYTGVDECDEQAIINFNHSSVDSFPGTSAIFYQVDTGYSERVHLKSGESYVDLLSGNFERWGDYSGSQRRYNNPDEVWVNGFYGYYHSGPTIGAGPRRHKTWIAGLESIVEKECDVAIQEEELLKDVLLYPNPSIEEISFRFINPEKQFLKFEIIDLSGKIVKTLIYDKIKAGENILTFSINPLTTGTYFLAVKTEKNELIAQEKIIKQ